MTNIKVIFVSLLLITISLLICSHQKQKEVFLYTPTIVCIMITGKDQERLKYAKLAINNFNSQDYPNKKLLIINHNETTSVLDSSDKYKNIFEFQIDKEKNNLTLGDLRNIALQLVPINSYWTIWDDDDWRSPSYLSSLWERLVETKSNFIACTQRMEYNKITKRKWIAVKKNGFVHILAPIDHRIKYLSKDTMEDVNIIQDYKNLGYKMSFINISTLYFRLVHENNTSLYVDKQRSYLIKGSEYYEKLPTHTEETVIKQVIQEYYKSFSFFE